jgi:hypothetical protein
MKPAPKTEDDRVVLQTMGEMCLAEEMFEEARQVFERLLRAEPTRKSYLELLNKARAGLGLGPVTGPPPPPGAVPAPPPGFATPPLAAAPLRTSPAPVTEASPPPVAPAATPTPPTEPKVMGRPEIEPVSIRKSAQVKSEGPHVAQPTLDWARPEPPYHAPSSPAVPSTPTLPVAPVAAAPLARTPSAPPATPVPAPVAAKAFVSEKRIPALSGAGATTSSGAKIVRAAHSMSLGELPPATPTILDFDDDIIE